MSRRCIIRALNEHRARVERRRLEKTGMFGALYGVTDEDLQRILEQDLSELGERVERQEMGFERLVFSGTPINPLRALLDRSVNQ